MGSCQSMQSELTQEIAATQTSSKKNTNKNPQAQNEMIMSNELAKIESELLADDELFSMNIYTSVKKNKQSYNFQEEELSTIKTSPQKPIEMKNNGKQKRKRYRTSLTHQEFQQQIQDRDPLGLSLQLGNDQDSNSRSYKSILKKNSNIKSMSGSPVDNNKRSVHFAGGTNFRSKSQRSIKRSTKVLNQPSNFKQQSQKNTQLATDGRSPLRKQHKSSDGIQDRCKYHQDLQLFGKPRINYILF